MASQSFRKVSLLFKMVSLLFGMLIVSIWPFVLILTGVCLSEGRKKGPGLLEGVTMKWGSL